MIPVVIAVQGMALLATLAYAAVEAVRVILAGGADVTAGSLVAYGAVSAVVSIIIWRYVRQVDRTSDLLVAEARQWGASAAFSALVAVGAVVAMILGAPISPTPTDMSTPSWSSSAVRCWSRNRTHFCEPH